MRNWNIFRQLSIGLTLVIGITAGCKKEPVPPAKAVLSLPLKNSACVTGQITSNTESVVSFVWEVSAHTDRYELYVKNLLTGITIDTSLATNKAELSLLRNTPYSWYVVSRSNKSSVPAQSESWKFYNSGVSVVSHSPFPAEAVSPAFAHSVNSSSGKINLSWTASDVDNDIVNYNIYLGTNSSPALIAVNISNTFFNDVSVTSGTTYYWKVVTKDSQGNSSDSPLFHFKIN